MVQFTQPVSMQVTQEQYHKDLKEPLKELGYNITDITSFIDNLLITNFGNKADDVTNYSLVAKTNKGRYFINHYNPELFLALAAMSNEQYGIAGEYWKCINIRQSTVFTINKLYKANSVINTFNVFIDDRNYCNGYYNENIQNFVKATKQELIELFNKKEAIMSKVDRTISIKCANQEEFDVVVLCLKDNGECISTYCTTAHSKNCLVIFFDNTYNTWNSGHKDNSYNNIKTPQELGIINNSQSNNMQTEFPKKWVIKLHKEVKQWIEKEYKTDVYSADDVIYYFHFPNYGDYKSDFKIGCHTSSEIKKDYIEITLQQFKDNIVNKPLNKPNMQNSLTRAQLLKLHDDFNCCIFRLAIEEILRTNILAHNDTKFFISDNAIQRLIKEGRLEQKAAVKALGIVLEEDKSVDVSGFLIDNTIQIRNGCEFANKALSLSDYYNWEIKRDSQSNLCLIPTKK